MHQNLPDLLLLKLSQKLGKPQSIKCWSSRVKIFLFSITLPPTQKKTRSFNFYLTPLFHTTSHGSQSITISSLIKPETVSTDDLTALHFVVTCNNLYFQLGFLASLLTGFWKPQQYDRANFHPEHLVTSLYLSLDLPTQYSWNFCIKKFGQNWVSLMWEPSFTLLLPAG